jgi:phage shock protein PspC (stress-responsive transcriptional regulator)
VVQSRQLERARHGKRLAGVCAGLANYTGVDVTLIRVGFLIFALVGVGEVAYLLLWLLAPKAPKD